MNALLKSLFMFVAVLIHGALCVRKTRLCLRPRYIRYESNKVSFKCNPFVAILDNSAKVLCNKLVLRSIPICARSRTLQSDVETTDTVETILFRSLAHQAFCSTLLFNFYSFRMQFIYGTYTQRRLYMLV